MSNSFMDPISNTPLIDMGSGMFCSEYTGNMYMQVGEKIVPLKDPISGGDLIKRDDGMYISESTGRTFTFQVANEGEEPAFYPKYLPYSNMWDIKARIENGRLVGENGISFSAKEGHIDLPMTEGLRTQEEIDSDIADKHQIDDIIIGNLEIEDANRLAEIRYNNELYIRELYRKGYTEICEKTGIPLEKLIRIESGKTQIPLVLNPQVEDRPVTIKDYIPDPEPPVYSEKLEMPQRLQKKVEEVSVHNAGFYDLRAKSEEDFLKTRSFACETRLKTRSRNGEMLSNLERAENYYESEKQIVQKYRQFVLDTMERQNLSLKEVVGQYGSRMMSDNVIVNFNPESKDDGSPLSIEDYIKDAKIPQLLIDSKQKPLTDKAVYDASEGVAQKKGYYFLTRIKRLFDRVSEQEHDTENKRSEAYDK